MAYLREEIKKLGFGLMRLPKLDDDTIDVEQTKEMVDLFLKAGFTYFDTAWAYAGSEDAIRQALVERYPREKFRKWRLGNKERWNYYFGNLDIFRMPSTSENMFFLDTQNRCW